MSLPQRPTRVLITGGGGFLGVAVARLLLAREPGLTIRCSDIVRHPRLEALAGRIELVTADLRDPAACAALLSGGIDTVFHFASLVSGGAERDFRAGLEANVLATITLLEACRTQAARPRVIFPSSIATFGGAALPETVDDWTQQQPQNSYGVAKVIGEQLLNDYSRKGFIDGRGVRLPAIVVRDEPNTAASGFASGLIREPLAGRPYVCPVGEDTRIPLLSVGACARLLVALGDLGTEALGDQRTLNAPSISPSAGEIAAAVRARCPAAEIGFRPQAEVEAIIRGWPRAMRSARAESLGLRGDRDIASIVAEHAETQVLAG